MEIKTVEEEVIDQFLHLGSQDRRLGLEFLVLGCDAWDDDFHRVRAGDSHCLLGEGGEDLLDESEGSLRDGCGQSQDIGLARGSQAGGPAVVDEQFQHERTGDPCFRETLSSAGRSAAAGPGAG
ncbi:hypothetical protein [Arthrobacter sp.]|uniref:hypothetical protein n=1 Tax=Arthrobacter sp. TaxID=1667 RepID=UPI003A8F9B8D